MNLKNSFILSVAMLLLVSCSTFGVYKTIPRKPPRNAPSDDATIKLAEASNSISDQIIELSQIQAAATPPIRDVLIDPHPYALQTRASIDWVGPVAPLVRKIALAGAYRVRVLGVEPAIPVLVNISVHDATLGDILRNIDFQVRENNKASILILPNDKIIELRYARL